MRKLSILLVLAMSLSLAHAQNERDLLPSSELDIAYHQIGGSIKAESFLIENPSKYMVTKAIIVTDLKTGEVTSGLEIRSYNTSGVWYNAYLDVDEIDRCLDLFDYFQSNYTNRAADEVQTTLKYHSRSGALIGISTDQKDWTIYIKPDGATETSSSYFKQKDLPKVIKVFEDAKRVIAEKH